MKFALGYILRIIKTLFVAGGKSLLVTMLIIGLGMGIIGIDYSNPEPEKYMIVVWCLVTVTVLWIVFMLVFTVYEFANGYKVEKIHNEKGFCTEYFYAYEKAYIRSKVRNQSNLIVFAEIYMRLGDCDSALDILESISLNELTSTQRAGHIFVHIMTAIKMKNIAAADKIWLENERFINENINKPHMGGYTNLLYYAMVLTDCAAGRYERALKTCDGLLKGGYSNAGDYLVLRTYLLKKLGQEDEINGAIADFNKFFEDWKPVYQSMKKMLCDDFEKALKGELPI